MLYSAADFKILRNIGLGFEAKVFIASMIGCNKKVVIKVPQKGRNLNHEHTISRIICGHGKFTNLPFLLGHTKEGWLIYEYKEDYKDLFSFYESEEIWVWDSKYKLEVMKNIASSLINLHSLGIYHMDIKPENILIGEEAILIDFGLSAMTIRKFDRISGTYGFIAPEVLLGQEFSEKADIFSLGVVFYWMIEDCRFPFAGYNDESYCSSVFSTTLQMGKGPFRDIILKMLSIKPEDRPSLNEIMNELKEIHL